MNIKVKSNETKKYDILLDHGLSLAIREDLNHSAHISVLKNDILISTIRVDNCIKDSITYFSNFSTSLSSYKKIEDFNNILRYILIQLRSKGIIFENSLIDIRREYEIQAENIIDQFVVNSCAYTSTNNSLMKLYILKIDGE